MILNSHAFICEHTNGAHVFKMYKKYVFFICAVFILEVRSDCDGYFECFSSFFGNIFASDTNIDYVNATSKNLPENFVEIKDVKFSELQKVLSEISSFIQQDITDQLKIQSDSVFSNVNPKTKVYVKTFSYSNSGKVLHPSFENLNVKEETKIANTKEDVNIKEETKQENPKEDVNIKEETKQENAKEETATKNSSSFTPSPQTATKSDEIKIIENQKDVSENEIPETDDIASYYDSVEDNATDYPVIDYVELYKDTTNEENVYEPTEVSTSADDEIQEAIVEYVDRMDKFIWDINNGVKIGQIHPIFDCEGEYRIFAYDYSRQTDASGNITEDIFPWIATIFLKNDTRSNQFEYYCDGALLDERRLITAARCVNLGNATVDANDLLVILGKRSLLSMVEQEQIIKVKQIITHENFTAEGTVENDLALLVLEHPVTLSEVIQPASIGEGVEEVEKSFTTAWNLQGDIVPVSLKVTKTEACNGGGGENMFCAQYGRDVPLCPSYGGIFACYHSGSWRLYGIRSGDTTDRGLCFDKNVSFTALRPYESWISNNE